MKKTVSASVGGYAFILEEEAYRKLEHYLDRVRLNLGTSDDVEEIMADVEGRISEIFKMELANMGKQVVDGNMVDHAISTMGAPEDYNINGEPLNEKSQQKNNQQHHSYRTLYRDPEDAYLGGVCSGIAHYLGWDPLVVRLIFVVLLAGFGSGLIVYIILWVLVPEAETTSEKLRMRGQPVTVESIKNKVERFSDEVKEWSKKKRDSKKKWSRSRSHLGARVENTVYEMGNVFGKILGAFLLLIGISMCIFIVNHFVNGNFSIGNADEHFLIALAGNPLLVFENKSDYLFLYWGIVTVLLLMMLGFLRSGINLLFNIRLKNKLINTVSVVISILAVVSISYGGIRLGKQFANEETVHQTHDIPSADKVIHVSVDHDVYFNDKLYADDADFDELFKTKGKKLVFGYPQLYIRRCETGGPRIEIEKSAHGPGRMDAIQHAENIYYPVEMTGDSILLQPVFTSPMGDRMRAQQVNITLYVPDSVSVQLDQNAYRVLRLESSDTQESVWNEPEYSIRKFIMEKKGLRPSN